MRHVAPTPRSPRPTPSEEIRLGGRPKVTNDPGSKTVTRRPRPASRGIHARACGMGQSPEPDNVSAACPRRSHVSRDAQPTRTFSALSATSWGPLTLTPPSDQDPVE